MEKGHWGHGHSNTFPEEQVRVPLVLWLPGQAPAVVTHRTSHLQIAPTLLTYLGVTQPARSYSSADTQDQTMSYFVFGEYPLAKMALAYYLGAAKVFQEQWLRPATD